MSTHASSYQRHLTLMYVHHSLDDVTVCLSTCHVPFKNIHFTPCRVVTVGLSAISIYPQSLYPSIHLSIHPSIHQFLESDQSWPLWPDLFLQTCYLGAHCSALLKFPGCTTQRGSHYKQFMYHRMSFVFHGQPACQSKEWNSYI